jgi:hypothetical protein
VLYVFKLLASNNKEDTKARWAHRIVNRDLQAEQSPNFWEVAVEALRFRRDFSHFLPRGSGPTDPAGTTLSRGPHIEGSVLNMPKASTIARTGTNGCCMTVANSGAIDA